MHTIWHYISNISGRFDSTTSNDKCITSGLSPSRFTIIESVVEAKRFGALESQSVSANLIEKP